MDIGISNIDSECLKEEHIMKNFGFIGMGNMAQAIAVGMIDSGKVPQENIYAYAPHQDKLKNNADRIGFTPCESAKDVVNCVDTVIMACKPYQIEGVLAEIGDALVGKNLLSIAAGWDLARYKKYLTDDTNIQFIMPNTPVMVKEGVIMLETDNTLTSEDHSQLVDIMDSLGTVVEIPAEHQDIGAAIAGCGPAYIDLVIEALGDAGVKYGLQRNLAYKLASQMILGAAKLQLETGLHPGILKDNVCSPGGTTICGVDALEHAGARKAFIDAVDGVMKKSIENKKNA